MKSITLFTARHRRGFFALSAVFALLTVCLLAAGCAAATWVSEGLSVITAVGAGFATISSFIAGLTGNTVLAAALAEVSSWITKVQTGLSDLGTLISQYQAAPNASLEDEIDAALADVQANVKQDFSNLGLPSTVLNVIAGIAALALNLLADFAAAINAVKNAATPEEFKLASAKYADVAKNLPATIADYKIAVNAILDMPTGDKDIDAALAGATRL